ncbi:S-type pyocin [Pseudomonas baetica]|uniref:S-type pyocin n=1 Tax=Pseudomonas baetica TaxID=674054 RepID=A0ABX4Q3N7_9PSED|nr:S-type pyocin domain-containing protein [Pseudomonas baetica]PKA71380.1 S-type pyocin [Pseudomonas baetica]
MSNFWSNTAGPSPNVLRPATPNNRVAASAPVENIQWDEPPAPKPLPPVMEKKGCVFAKSCNLPDGITDHKNSSGFVPVEKLADYGLWAVLSTGVAIKSTPTALQLVGSSSTGSTILSRLGGTLSLQLIEVSPVVAAGAAIGTLALLMPNTSISPDSAFYTTEQYSGMEKGRTRVRVNVKQLPDGSVNAYGFYTGGKTDWENVKVIKATPRGETFVADVGNGFEVIWTPAANPSDTLGIPALQGAPSLPSIWVYPPTEKSDQILVNPAHPPEYQDAIIWFPSTDIQPIYVMLSVRYDAGVVTGRGKPITGIWLEGASTGTGAPIPEQIADALRGRSFESFDDFRAAFWLEVSKDPVLNSQFIEDNQAKLARGRAPVAIRPEQVGERVKFEIHHIEYIKNGGEVYNVDNLAVMTPKLHIQVHKDVK